MIDLCLWYFGIWQSWILHNNQTLCPFGHVKFIVSNLCFDFSRLPEKNNNNYLKSMSYQIYWYASFDNQTLSNSKICLWDTKDINLNYVHLIPIPIHTCFILTLIPKSKQGIHFLQRGLLVKTSIHTIFKLHD